MIKCESKSESGWFRVNVEQNSWTPCESPIHKGFVICNDDDNEANEDEKNDNQGLMPKKW
jgi:hypothetical protein